MIRLAPYLLEHLQSTTKHSTYLLIAHTCNLATVYALSLSPQVKTKGHGRMNYKDTKPYMLAFL